MDLTFGVDLIKSLLSGPADLSKKIITVLNNQVASALDNQFAYLPERYSQNGDAVAVALLEFWLRSVFNSAEEWFYTSLCVEIVDDIIKVAYSLHRAGFVRKLLLQEHAKFIARNAEAKKKPKSTFGNPTSPFPFVIW